MKDKSKEIFFISHIANKTIPEIGRERIQYITVKTLECINTGPYFLGQTATVFKQEDIDLREKKGTFFRVSKIKPIDGGKHLIIEEGCALWLETDGLIYSGDRANTKRNLVPLISINDINKAGV